MTFIQKIPWRTILIIIICAFLFLPLGAKIGHQYSWLSTEKTLNNTTISKAINKATQTTEVTNEIDVKIDKVKNSDSLQINVNQSPNNNQEPVNIVTKKEDCKLDNTTYNKLSKSQKNRIERWIKD